MQKKLTKNVDRRVCDGPKTVVGRRRISQFVDPLARPHVIGEDLEVGYRQMAQQEARELEALEWAEATAGDIADDIR